MSENGRFRRVLGATDAFVDWYRVVQTRDPRFDGVVFIGVTTTGIYCRPVCTARTPGRDRCLYFKSAAEAEREGFRACFRCRPELAPGSATVDSAARLAALATRRIEEGVSDIEELATALGVTSRHLRRVLNDELGVSPIELLQTKRAGLARQLLLGTTLPVTDIAFASGFSSIRRFNTVIRERFDRSPTELRRRGARGARRAGLVLRLDYRPPLDWDALLEFLAARAIPEVESITDGVYRRTVRIGERVGFVAVRRDPARAALLCDVSLSLAPVVQEVVARVRRLFDLDAHPTVIAGHLARDPRLAPLVKKSRGLRLPGAFDGFEMASRAVLGQQVTVKGATTLAGRLAKRFGTPLETPFGEALSIVFPSAADLAAPHAAAAIALLGMPRTRADAIATLARAVAAGRLALHPHAEGSAPATMAALRELPGIGEWTAQYIAMRALAWPDAFPAGDLGVRHALGRDAATVAEAWRPWRAYAVMHVWRSHAARPHEVPAERRRLRRAG